MSFSLLQFQSFIWTDRASFLCKIIFLPISLCNAPCIKRARQLAIDPPPDQSRLCWDSREINYEYIGYRPSSKLVYGPMFLLIFIWQRVLIAFLSDEAYRSLFPRLSLFLPFFFFLLLFLSVHNLCCFKPKCFPDRSPYRPFYLSFAQNPLSSKSISRVFFRILTRRFSLLFLTSGFYLR